MEAYALLEYGYTTPNGFVVSLADLRTAMASLNDEKRTWWIVESHLDPKHPRVLIGYRNLGERELITDLSFILPIVEVRPEAGDDGILIVAHPETLTPDLVGLYLEADGLKQDMLADFDSFWSPLQEALTRAQS